MGRLNPPVIRVNSTLDRVEIGCRLRASQNDGGSGASGGGSRSQAVLLELLESEPCITQERTSKRASMVCKAAIRHPAPPKPPPAPTPAPHTLE